MSNRTSDPLTRRTNMKANVLFVVWWEGVHSNALIDNQVVGPLLAIKRLAPELSITLLLAGGWGRVSLRDRLVGTPGLSRLLGSRRRQGVDVAALREKLLQGGIDLVVRETVYAPKTVYLGWPFVRLFPFGHLRFLRQLIRDRDIEIVHCRSYSAAWVALLALKRLGTRVRLLFDTRGLIPEEGVVNGAFSSDSVSFRIWKNIEQRLLDSADAIVNVSETFSEYVGRRTANRRVFTIPASADVSVFASKASAGKKPVDFGASRVLVYVGSLGCRALHTYENLALAYRGFRRVFPGARLMVLTAADKAEALRELQLHGVDPAEVFITRSFGNAETAAYLQCAHYGVLPFRRMQSEMEKLIGYTTMASKAGEYLAAGLPILCYEGVGAASRLVAQSKVGCIFGDSDHQGTRLMERDLQAMDGNYAEVVRRCRDCAGMFDVNRNAQRYLDVYASLLSGGGKE